MKDKNFASVAFVIPWSARISGDTNRMPEAEAAAEAVLSAPNADQTDALHNYTLGKFLVTFGDVQSTDDLLAKLGCE